MKSSKSKIHTKVHKIPELYFENHQLTSCSGMVMFQALFQKMKLGSLLKKCFLNDSRAFGAPKVILLLIAHMILGNRRLREMDYYNDDPLLCRVLGISKIPDVSTVSRTLGDTNEAGYQKVKDLSREIVYERLKKEKLPRLTVDFDGSVISTKGHAEGSAVGYNKSKKGSRSYYPLLSTVAQTSQILNWKHRSGNVHDSNGAFEFILENLVGLQSEMGSHVTLETRMDSAFFNDETVWGLNTENVEFTISVPFERFTELKGYVENRKRWNTADDTWSFFEMKWKPKKWDDKYRFIFLRKKSKKITKGAIQLDLFKPVSHEYTYKVIVTNKTTCAKSIVHFHNGRGTQEGIFAECKQHSAMDYIPFKKRISNKLFFASSAIAHNLGREIQIETQPRARNTTEKRKALWIFESLGTLSRRLILKAGKLTNHSGELSLTMNANQSVKRDLLHYLDKIAA